MSQAGTLDVITSNPDIPTSFITDSGTAVPVANELEILGDAPQGSATSGSGNTVIITNLDASTTQKGVLETSTDAESIAGTSSVVAVTPESLKAKLGVQTANAIPYGQGNSSAIGWSAALTDGQVLIGSTAGVPVAANLTAGAGVAITNGAGSIQIALTGAGTGIDSLTPNSGTSPVIPDGAGNVGLTGSGSLTTVGGLNTLDVQLTGLTQYNVLVGAGTTTITKVAPSATSGVPLISQGAAADPVFGTAVVAGGGTGATTLTGVVIGNGTAAMTATSITTHAVVIGAASDDIAGVGPLTNGQLVIGSTGVAPVAATLTAGTNVSISNAAGSITINANVGAQVVSVTALTSAASPYTVLAADYYMTCNTSGGVLTIRLPDAPTTGRIFIIKDANGTADTNNITVTTVGGAVTIDGGTSFVMNTEYEAISLLFNGTSYEVH